MKRFISAFVVLTALARAAPAGTVVFDPPSVVFDRDGGSSTIMFDLAVTSELFPTINNVGLIVGSDDLILESWVYPAGWPCTGFRCHPVATDPPLYPSDLVGLGRFAAGAAVPLSVGTVTIRIPDGLAPGVYEVVVDAGRDGGLSRLSSLEFPEFTDPLFGTVQVTVIPEPGTLVGLGVGALWLFGRGRGRQARTGCRPLLHSRDHEPATITLVGRGILG